MCLSPVWDSSKQWIFCRAVTVPGSWLRFLSCAAALSFMFAGRFAGDHSYLITVIAK